MLVLLLGSNIGNFDTPAALTFLQRIRDVLQPGDLLLLGADLVKPDRELQLAYDDPLGVTAAFNKNLLVRINRELGGTFNLDAFEHRAAWNADEQRIEMHLVSRAAQLVRIESAGSRFRSCAANTSGPKARTSTNPIRSSRWVSTAGSRYAISGSTRTHASRCHSWWACNRLAARVLRCSRLAAGGGNGTSLNTETRRESDSLHFVSPCLRVGLVPCSPSSRSRDSAQA